MAKLNTRFRWDREHRTHKIFLTCVLWVGTCCPTGTGRWSGTGAPGASSSGQRGARTSCTNTGTSLSSASSPPATTRCSTSGQYNNVSRPCVGCLTLIMFLIATSLQYHAMEDVGSVPLDLAPAISWHHQTASCGRPDSGCQVHHLITASSCQNNPPLQYNAMFQAWWPNYILPAHQVFGDEAKFICVASIFSNIYFQLWTLLW